MRTFNQLPEATTLDNGAILVANNANNTATNKISYGNLKAQLKQEIDTDLNTTYTFASGDSNGQIKVTPSDGAAQNISVKGLKSAAYTESSAYATASHTHSSSEVTGLGTAASKDVPTSGNASTSQVVMGNDSRLSDSRPASDVSAWAKESTKPTYTKSEVGLGNVGNFKAVSTEANQGLTDTEKANARANIGAGASSFSGSYNDLTDKPTIPTKISDLTDDSNFVESNELSTVATTGAYSDLSGTPTLGTASEKNIPTSGNASSTEVVMGNDTRLTDARNAADVSSWAKAENKPTYTASEVGAISSILKGANNGVAELDANGKVPSAQLPAFVDDVLEYSASTSFPSTGETGKIYVDTTTNKTYRWSGTAYVEISASLALGETSSTAYYGNKGKTAYDHSQLTSGNPHGVTKTDVGLGNVGNFKAVSTVASQGLTDTEKSNARANIGAGTGNGTITGITMNGSSKGTSGNIDLGTVITSHQDISTKADKVTSATNGNFAGLNASGNLTDSGKKASDFAASSHNQASNTINAMTGYSKPSSTSAIGTSDSLNVAMGKLEKGIETPISDADWSTLSTLFS